MRPEVLRRLWLVTFVPSGREAPRGRARILPAARGRDSTELVEELSYTKERLQHSLEELQATNEELMSSNEELTSTNEELQSANEELQSSNEELQSTNEELETSKEELQSTNEELVTLNEELQNRMEELNISTDDLQNVLSASTSAVVLVGTDLRIRRFSGAAERLLNSSPATSGAPSRTSGP